MASPDDGEQFTEFDDVFKLVNSFGRYQQILYHCACVPILLMAFPWGILLFAMATPNFHCATANSTCPLNQCCDNCTVYAFDGPFTSTVSEWGLVCDRAYINAVIQSCMLGGMLIGASVSGIVSDTYGRKICIFLSTTIMVFSGFGSAFVDCTSLFAFLWFVLGFGLTGLILAQYIYVMEIVGPKSRTTAGNIPWFFWSAGFFIVCMLAYFIRDWRVLVIVTTIPGAALLLFWRVFPESPRWLVAHNRLDEAQAILTNYGGANNNAIDALELRATIEAVREDQINKERENTRYTPLDLVRTRKLRKWTLAVGYNWFAVSFLSNAMNLYIANMSGNIYLNFTVVQIIATAQQPIIWVLLQKFGRRVPHSCVMVLTGLLCFSVLIVPERFQMVRRGFFLVAVGISYSMWTNIYLITSELYPTVIRNTAQGSGSTVGRIGAIAAPYIVMMGHLPSIGITAPMLLFGGISVVAGVVSLWIPETLRANMHQTIEEAEAAKEDYGIPCCCSKPESSEGEEMEVMEGETGDHSPIPRPSNEANEVCGTRL